jgi:formamidopyrimidine-DNA glycosylase
MVRAVEVRRRDVVVVEGGRGGERPLPLRNQGEYLLNAMKIESVERRGKQLALIGKGRGGERALIVHLGMSGQLFCVPPGDHLPEASHVHVMWRLDSGARLVFRDPRRFGGVWSLPGRAALAARWAELGPDALTIEAEELGKRLTGTKRAIKSALLDQSVLAGVGNIYADESLFLAGIAPAARASDLSAADVVRLAEAIHAVLNRAIAAGGSSLAGGSYVNADRKPGSYQRAHAVYGRSGEKCLMCSRTLRAAQISGRTTVWCPRCQVMP